MTTSLILADDHPVVRAGICKLLEAQPDLALVGEASDGLEAVRLVERLQPDLLVLDLLMPGLNGLDVLRVVSRRCPRTQVVVFSMVSAESSVLETLHQGARGYVLKTGEPGDLLKAVRAVAGGQRFLGPPLSERDLGIKLGRAKTTLADPHEALSPREREVLQLAAEGNTSAEIARRLSISPRTVEMHRANLMRKLSLRNQTDLILYALRRGIIPLQN